MASAEEPGSVTFQAELVSSERRNRLSKKFFRVLVSSFNSCDIDLLPFDRHVVRLENSLYGFGHFSTNAITCIS